VMEPPLRGWDLCYLLLLLSHLKIAVVTHTFSPFSTSSDRACAFVVEKVPTLWVR
jgi:hypothetical protein